MSEYETAAPERLLVRPRTAETLLDVGATTVWGLIKAGELDTVYVGSGRRITFASLRRYVEKLRAAEPTGPRKSLEGATMASLRARRRSARHRVKSAPSLT
jgi:hypothetical protein